MSYRFEEKRVLSAWKIAEENRGTNAMRPDQFSGLFFFFAFAFATISTISIWQTFSTLHRGKSFSLSLRALIRTFSGRCDRSLGKIFLPKWLGRPWRCHLLSWASLVVLSICRNWFRILIMSQWLVSATPTAPPPPPPSSSCLFPGASWNSIDPVEKKRIFIFRDLSRVRFELCKCQSTNCFLK